VPESLTIEERANVWIVTARGELDYAYCDTFRVAVERVIHDKPRATIIDLSGVRYLDSSCLGLLLSLHRDYTLAGGRLVLIASETVDSVLSITRLGSIFPSAPDVESALAALAGPAPKVSAAIC
jgi:anti-sigma B factor antagonist